MEPDAHYPGNIKLPKLTLPCSTLLTLCLGAAPSASAAASIVVDDTEVGGQLGSSSLAVTATCVAAGCVRAAVVGYRTSAGRLKLARYQADFITTDSISRTNSATAGSIPPNSPISLTPLPQANAGLTEYVTAAFRDGGGDLMLIVWSASLTSRLGDNVLSGHPGNAVSEVSSTTVSSTVDSGSNPPYWIVTAARTAAGNLQVSAWELVDLPGSDDVDVIELDTETFGPATQIDIASTGTSVDQSVVTAFRNSQGSLQLKTLDLTASGNLIERDDFVSGPVSRVQVRGDMGSAVTAVRDGGGDLLLTRWDISGSGQIDWSCLPGNGCDRQIDSGNAGSTVSGDLGITGSFGGSSTDALSVGRRNSGQLEVRLWERE